MTTNHNRLRSYEQLEIPINVLDAKYREKSVIEQNIYNDIVRYLLLTKGRPSDFSTRFIY